MATLAAVIDALVVSREFDRATVGRLAFWTDALGDRELSAITPEDVDAALVRLAERGRLSLRRGKETQTAGVPLAGSTFNRNVSQLGSVYCFARRLRLLPRAHVPPTNGIERAPESADPACYLRAGGGRATSRRGPGTRPQVGTPAGPDPDRVPYGTSGRKPDGPALGRHGPGQAHPDRRQDEERTTHRSGPLRARGRGAPQARQAPGALVFKGRVGRPFGFRALWARVCEEAGLPGRNFNQLRHGCGSALATAGIGQAQIMGITGRGTLSASARYVDQNANDKLAVVGWVFG